MDPVSCRNRLKSNCISAPHLAAKPAQALTAAGLNFLLCEMGSLWQPGRTQETAKERRCGARVAVSWLCADHRGRICVPAPLGLSF